VSWGYAGPGVIVVFIGRFCGFILILGKGQAGEIRSGPLRPFPGARAESALRRFRPALTGAQSSR
jgi:hypothetical protein